MSSDFFKEEPLFKNSGLFHMRPFTHVSVSPRQVLRKSPSCGDMNHNTNGGKVNGIDERQIESART